MIKAVIFDFDGLVLDTETPWYEAFKEVLRLQFEFDLPLEEFAKCVGSNDLGLYSYLEENIGDALNVDDFRERTSKLHTQYLTEAGAREGVVEYLNDAKKAGLKIALATSSNRDWATTHLTNLQLLSYFDHLVTSDDVEKVKPAPDLFLKALEVLEVESHEAIVFEDSLNGLIAAQEANISTVIVTNPVTASLPFENYHLKLTSMTDMSLQEIIESLSGD